jgi:nucleotide-binding universal stress UspA family protein
MRVLVAADGSKHGTVALCTACRILSPKNRSVDVLCVVPRVHPKKPGAQRRLERRAARIADAVVERLAQDGVSASPMVQTGSPVGILIGARGYDVAVVSAQSHPGVSAAGLGPVASRMLEHATANVLVARAGDVESSPKILIPVDGSDVVFRALETIQGILDLPAAEVTFVHVVETPWIRPVDDQEWLATEEEPDQESQSELEHEFTAQAEAMLDQAREMLPAGTAVNSMIYHGIPAEEILTEANSGNYDLVVLVATGARDLKHRILGSVSSKVAWNAPCSVLLVR